MINTINMEKYQCDECKSMVEKHDLGNDNLCSDCYKDTERLDEWIAENLFKTPLRKLPHNRFTHSIDSAIFVLEILYDLSRSWGMQDNFTEWHCKKFEKEYQTHYMLGKFSHGDYPSLPSFWGIFEEHRCIPSCDEGGRWLSEHKNPAMAICLAAFFLKTGQKWSNSE